MAVTKSTDPIDILFEMGIDLDDLSEQDYLSALKEAIATIEFKTGGKGDERSAALREEVIKIRKGKRKPKEKKTTISPDAFFGKKKPEGQAQSVPGQKALPGGGAIVKASGGAMQKFIQSPVGESTEKIVEEINQKLDDLIATIREEQKLEEKSLEKERVSAERDKRSKAENKLESGFIVLKKSAEKILKPVKGIFDRIFDFIKKIILGNVLMKIIDWFADDENQGKIKTIFRFIEDFWPALTAAVLLFGTGIGGLVKGIIGTVVKLTVGLLKVVPKFLKFFATPLGAALGIVGGAAVGLISQATTKSNDPEAKEGQTQLDDTMDFGGTTGAPISADMLGYNKGGFVDGGGPNRDTVPAMLSPGEFVMSRGAVQRYGKSTLESMNSVGGGTNVPVINQSFVTYAQGGGMMPYSTVNTVNESKLKKRTNEEKKMMEAPEKPSSGSFGLPPGVPGLMGGGGATNVLTEQAKSRSIGAVLSDVFGVFKKKKIDPQTILDGGDLYQDNRVMMSPAQQVQKKNMSVSQNQIQRTPIGPPTKPKPQVEFLPLGSGGSNGMDAQVAPTESQIPAFSASTSGSGNKMQTLGIG